LESSKGQETSFCFCVPSLRIKYNNSFEGITMGKFMEILVSILAIIGLACVVKHFMHCEEGCCLCSLFKKGREKDKQTGSRYGSNPVEY
jgi:hypothetical protein